MTRAVIMTPEQQADWILSMAGFLGVLALVALSLWATAWWMEWGRK